MLTGDMLLLGCLQVTDNGLPPNLWAQLLSLCATDPALQPAVIDSVVQQVQQQREQGFQQAAHLQQLSQLQQHQQQELAADSAEAAGLHGRVQALKEQLQQVLAALQQR